MMYEVHSSPILRSTVVVHPSLTVEVDFPSDLEVVIPLEISVTSLNLLEFKNMHIDIFALNLSAHEII
jgi:hypothetical protein